MPRKTPSKRMDLDRLYHLMIALSLVGLAMVILGLVGEHLGWWNDVGEVLLSFGTLISVLTALVALLVGSTRGQVRRAGDAVLSNNAKLDTANDRLVTIDGKLDKLDSMDTKLDKLEKLDELDTIQAELDAQTGVLDRQVRILEQIRDGSSV